MRSPSTLPTPQSQSHLSISTRSKASPNAGTPEHLSGQFLAFQAPTPRGKAANPLGSNSLAPLRNLRVSGRGGSLCGVCSKNRPILGLWANRERTAGVGRQNGSKIISKCRQKVKCLKIYIFRQHLTIWEHLECGGLSFVCFRQFFCFGAHLKTKRG